MKLTLSFKSSRFSTWPNSQDKNLNVSRTKRAFKVKWEAFFTIFKGLSCAKYCLRPESVPLITIKPMKPLLSDNSSQSSRNTLVDKNRIISDHHELAKTFDTFLKNAVGNLNIKYVMNSAGVNRTGLHKPVDICILKYRGHPSIKLIRENVSFVNPFIFSESTETDIERETMKLNPKNSVTSGNIPTKVLKESSYACNLALINICNFEMLESSASLKILS